MYEQFFRLERRPFAATPDPACFFSCESIAQVLDQLTVCVERGQGIGILTSPAGMGKTLICQRLVKDLGERFRMIFLGNSNFPTRRSLLQAILFETGVEFSRKDEQELRHELRSVLRELRQEYESVVLIVDEAHSFEAELLEEIRTLVDLGDEGHSLVRVILSGQLELEERMTDRQFDAINQRISTHVYLEPLSLAESTGYLRHRVEWAGGNPDEVFSNDATTIIARASCGVPRCLNQLADHSLLLGFAADESPVQEATVREALEDLKQLPLHWNDVNDSDRMIAAQAGTESDADQQSGFEDSAQDIEDSWEQETDEATVDLCELDEAHQEIDSAVANEAAIESPTDETAPLAVFEFGADESLAEDSSLDDHGEGDTLDEVAATIEVGEVETADLEPQEDAASQEEETALQAGQPSPPVAQISGVVLDLSSQVCGVSECVDGVAEFGSAISCEDSSEKTESAHADGSGPDSEFGAGIDLPEQTGVEATEEHTVDSTQPESTVFEFGAEDSSEVEPAAESESEFTNEPETSEEEPAHASELHCDSEDVPGEEKVLAEVASVEHEIVEFEASAGEAHEETEAPTEEAVLEEIAAVEREISEVDWDEKHTADDAEPVTVIDETSEPSFDFAQPDSEEPGAPDCESPHLAISNSQTSEPAGSRFEEVEVVSDPYAVIEEPLSSGIVWDVSCQTETSTEDVPHEDTVEDVAIADAAGHGDSEQESPEAVAEQFGEFPEADGIPAQIELEEAIFEPLSEPVSEELSEAIMHDWCDDNGEECAELDIVEEPSAELSLFADEAGRKEAADSEDEEVEDGGLEPAREIHPDRYIEAIVPMLGEIDEFCAKEFKADAPERDAVDIEAELVNAISGEDPAIEDEIGATVLDICLDAQWAIQQGGERADEARESARSFAEVEVESEAEGYDIVEPDFSPESDFTSQVSELGQLESTEAVSTSGQLPGRRPFGSLFSDLRRRGS